MHLAHIGHPLIGDPLYGQGFKSKLRKLPEPLQGKLAGLNRQALHAAASRLRAPGDRHITQI